MTALPEKEEFNKFLDDQAVDNIADDKFNFAPYAKYLADVINALPADKSYVLAINGGWGTGKTSILNFIKEHFRKMHLEQKQTKAQEESRIKVCFKKHFAYLIWLWSCCYQIFSWLIWCPLSKIFAWMRELAQCIMGKDTGAKYEEAKDGFQIIDFNPWMFSGESTLVQRFFDQIRANLSTRPELAEQLGSYSLLLLDELLISKSIPGAGGVLLNFVKGHTNKPPDLIKIKSELKIALQKNKIRFLVVIDDIDRLASDEIRQLFRIFKAVADLPNILYLLAFDKAVVSNALKDEHCGDGNAYLEKIIQASFSIPSIDRFRLKKMLSDILRPLIEQTSSQNKRDLGRTISLYNSVQFFIDTPRRAKLLINAFKITYPPLKEEVNIFDFLAMEALRLFAPLIYEEIRNKPLMYVGQEKENLKKDYFDKLLSQVPVENKEAVENILIKLFPAVSKALDESQNISHDLSDWRRRLRICSPERYVPYFQYTLPDSHLGNKEIKELLIHHGTNQKQIEMFLTSLANEKKGFGYRRLESFFMQLEDLYKQGHFSGTPATLLKALLNVGDEFLEKEINYNDNWLWSIIDFILKAVPADKWEEVLTAGARQSQSLATLVITVSNLEKEEACKPYWSLLKDIALKKIRNKAQNKESFRCPMFCWILNSWKIWAGKEEVKKWIDYFLIDSNLTKILFAKCLDYRLPEEPLDAVTVESLKLKLFPCLEDFIDLAILRQKFEEQFPQAT